MAGMFTELRGAIVSPSSAVDLLKPVKSPDTTVPDAEEIKAAEKTSTTNLVSEASLKPTGASAVAGDEGALTVPRTIGLIGAISFIVGTIIGSTLSLSINSSSIK